MRQQSFEAVHARTWAALRGWLEDQPTLDPQEVPPAYRRLCHHLALARERHYSPALVERLQELALALHQRIYGAGGEGPGGAAGFLGRGLPRLVREEWRLVLVSGLLFFGPCLAIFAIVRAHPNLVHLVLGPEEAARMVQMYDPKAAVMGRTGAARDVLMFGFYIYNNIGIDFQIFASGLLAGIGPLFFLPFNGLMGGAVMAHLTNQGLTAPFYGFVSGHSSFEILGAVLSGAGGLRMGLGILRPGRRSRMQALREGARRGSRLLFGAAVLTFVAACFEGFWSANTLVPWKAKVALGIVFWAGLALWLGLAGRGAAVKPGTLGFVPRPRRTLEALDLGLSLLQAHAGPVARVWALQTGLVLVLALPFLHRAPLWTLLALWWLKPWLDRGVLFVLSRAVFGQPASLWDFLRETPAVHRRGVVAGLLWRRFSLARSFVLPVFQLEGLRGPAFRARARVLSRQGGGTGFLLTMALWLVMALTFFGCIGLAQVMAPSVARVQLWSQFEGMTAGFQWFLLGIGLLALTLTEPLFAAAGFGLYLNRRTQLEGWDLEQSFRRLAARLAPLLLLLLWAGPLRAQAPPAPQAAQDALPEKGPLRPGDPARARVEQVLRTDPAFRHTREVRSLHYTPTGREPRWLRSVLDALFAERRPPDPSAPWQPHLPEGLGEWIALFGKIILVAGLVVLAVWLAYVLHGRLRLPVAADEDWEAPGALAGLDIRPESLPPDVPGAARALFDGGQGRAALALLYRGALAGLVHRRGLEIPASATEGDCLAAARATLEAGPAGAFRELTGTWLRLAYNGEAPAPEAFEALCAAWPGAFGGRP